MTSPLSPFTLSSRHSSSPFPPVSLGSPLSSSPSPTLRSPHYRGPGQSSTFPGSELTLARKWIEDCTGRVEKNKCFREYLQDGTVLCELVQGVRPDLIKKIKRIKSPFAWRENLSFFLEACKDLGLKGSQLFSTEDLIASGARTPTTKTKGFRGESERKLRNVAITVFWLSRAVRTLPNYTGPLLDFDPSSLGDWDQSEKVLVSREGVALSPVPATSSSQQTTNTGSLPGKDSSSPTNSPPLSNSKNSSPSSPPLPISPYQSPTIKVKIVDTVTPRATDQTLKPQVIVHVGRCGHRRRNSSPSSSTGHSRSNSLVGTTGAAETSRTLRESGKTKSTPALDALRSIRDQLSESEKVLSDLTQELILTQKALAAKKATSSVEDSSCAASASPKLLSSTKQEEKECSGEEKDSVSLGELINAELLLNSHKPPLQAESNEFPHRSPSVNSSTASEVSTIVPRDLVPSRCSALSLPEDTVVANGGQDFSLAGTSRESESSLGINLGVTPHSPVTADPEGFTNPLSHSPPNNQGSSEVLNSEGPLIEYSGSQTTFHNYSPEVDVDAILAGDTYSDTEDIEESVLFPALTISAPSPLLEHGQESSCDPLSVVNQSSPLNHISEEEELDETSKFLGISPQQQLQTHPIVAALKEESRKSFHSSSSSLDSNACSVIEVSYTTTAGDSDGVSSSYSPLNHDSTDTNTASSSYCSSSSEAEPEGTCYEVVPEETLNHYFVDLETADLEDTASSVTAPESKNLTRYHSLPNFEQANLETIPEEMAVTAQVMRIYPAQSVGEITSGVTVPHHRVHIPSSNSSVNGPESPSSKCNNGTDTTVHCVSPSTPTPSEETHMRGVTREEFCVQEVEAPGLMAAPIQILEDGEDEEEDDVDAELVAPKDRKISGEVVPDSAFSKMNFTLSPPPLGGGGGLARVQSDALPLTLHADKLTLPDPAAEEGEAEENSTGHNEPADLFDFSSIAAEIGSSLDSLNSSRLSVTTSHNSSASLAPQKSVSSSAIGSQGEVRALAPGRGLRHHKQQSGNSFVDGVLVSSHGDRGSELAGQGTSPVTKCRSTSVPTRATSDSILPSPYSSDSPNLLKVRNRRTSGGDKRQQRLANIAESTRAAMTYTATHRSKKTESLPRDHYQLHHWHSHSRSKSGSSDDELLGTSPTSLSILGKGAAMATTAENKTKVVTTGSPSGSLNLHSLSMDETRKASMTEMEEIWKLVENESGSSNTSVDTTSEGAASGTSGSGGGRGRRLPSIALESHLSPQHASSFSSSSRRNCDESAVFEDFDGGSNPRRALENGHAGLDISQVEGVLKETDPVPWQSTPKRPGGASLTTPNTSLLASGGPRPSPVTRKDLDSLLTTLRSLGRAEGQEAQEREDGSGLQLLEQMLQSNTFKRAQKVHDTVQELVRGSDTAPRPVIRRVVPTTQEARHHFHHHTEPSSEVEELRSLLRDPHIQALMFCHDRVSSGDYYLPRRHYPRIKQDPVDIILSGSVLNYIPVSSLDNSLPLSRDVPSSRKEDATIVYLKRTNRPLGCTIYKQGEAVFVGKLLKGCDAELSEVLREGDELLEVNGVPVAGRSTDEIVRLMSGEAGATLAFTIIPIHDDNIDLNFEPKYVRAHFNYSPTMDEEIPCQPLGLKFEKGDILEISNQDDPDWWQARKVFDDGAESLPGLIPARHRQQQREAMTRSYPPMKGPDDQHRKKKGLMSMLTRKKKKTVFYNQGSNQNMLAVGDEVVTYEDVVRMAPNPQWKRPIVLVGASGVGKGTLIRKLINSDHTHFAAVVQHTTRATHPGEVDGHTYHFVTREEFELDILQERFLEYEDVKGYMYGTSVSAIKKIVESGRVPVMDLQPQSLKRVRYSGLKPYVVFVASPRLERLVVTRRVGPERPLRRRTSSSTSYDMDSSQIYTEPELQHLLVESRLIESQYSHYFDWIIVNDDLSVASDMLKEVARRAEEETQWVPASWMMADHSF